MEYKIIDKATKQFLLLVLLLIGYTMQMQAQNVKRHEVKAGETLYGISRAYGLSESEIKAANPSINASGNIMAGQVLVIPEKKSNIKTSTAPVQANEVAVDDTLKYKLIYTVKKKETLYSISKQFDVTVNEILAINPNIKGNKIKKGKTLYIPYTQAELEAMKPVVVEEEIIVKEPVQVSVALIMPFGLSHEKKSKEAITMIDMYEGFMLALSELKQEGVSGKVYVYDEADIDSILTLPQIKDVKLIVGAKDQHNIQKLIDFTKKHNISLVVPLSSQTTLVKNNPNVFQVNHKMETEDYNKAFSFCYSMHQQANFIFINIEDQTDKMDNVIRMKTFLNGENKSYHSLGYSELDSLGSLLVEGKENILISSSSTKTGFDRLVKKLGEMELEYYDIDLFGYPDWQAFAAKESESFRKYNCTFFTSFYNNPNATETYAFNRRFHNAFGRDQYNTYPHYGMLGYDIAKFFLKNMYVEGDDFTTNIENLNSQSLQNPMHFTKHNSWSGYENNALMLVRYNSDGTISVKQL